MSSATGIVNNLKIHEAIRNAAKYTVNQEPSAGLRSLNHPDRDLLVDIPLSSISIPYVKA